MLKDFLILALDVASFTEAKKIIHSLGSLIYFYKVGMQLYFSAGNKIIDYLHSQNKKIFLDLKLNDIPQTVSNAVDILAKQPIQYLTLFCNPKSIAFIQNHTCIANKRQTSSSLKLLNVTVLTSEKNYFIKNKVYQKTKISLSNGASGVICSGLETAYLRKKIKKDFIIINPGIRLGEENLGDQKRITTPKDAMLNKATHIVMGRSILQSSNKIQTIEKIYQSLH